MGAKDLFSSRVTYQQRVMAHMKNNKSNQTWWHIGPTLSKYDPFLDLVGLL